MDMDDEEDRDLTALQFAIKRTCREAGINFGAFGAEAIAALQKIEPTEFGTVSVDRQGIVPILRKRAEGIALISSMAGSDSTEQQALAADMRNRAGMMQMQADAVTTLAAGLAIAIVIFAIRAKVLRLSSKGVEIVAENDAHTVEMFGGAVSSAVKVFNIIADGKSDSNCSGDKDA